MFSAASALISLLSHGLLRLEPSFGSLALAGNINEKNNDYLQKEQCPLF